jgi:N utilization substance protein B
MGGPVGTRREARERALGLLYEADAKGVDPRDLLDELPVRPDEFAVDVVRGVAEHGAQIDDLLRRYARDWAIERMPVIDRMLLRMAVFELLHRPDVPTGVVISEAVDLAKSYSTDDSGRFVNGVLAAIADEVRPGTQGPPPG